MRAMEFEYEYYNQKPQITKIIMIGAHSTKRKCLSILATVVLAAMLLIMLSSPKSSSWKEVNKLNSGEMETFNLPPVNMFEEYERTDYLKGRWRDFGDQEIGNMSTLARILFLDETPPSKKKNKDYKILVWKYGKTIENRHMKHFTNKTYDPFESCSAKNCFVTYKDEDIDDADIVIFHMHRMAGLKDLPGKRNPNQIWAFLTDESPYHMFLNSNINKIKDYNNVFNWSMTYSFKSDIPVPYGRTVPLPTPDDSLVDDLEKWKKSKRRDVLIAILGSNCGSTNHRWQYVKKLKQYIPVDMYGGCGTLKCAGHFKSDCEPIGHYMFYLSFENSNCDEYITEKLWWNAYSKNSIPIVMGAPETSLSKLLPPHSYINVENFASPRDLANYIKYLVNNTSEFQPYFQWKKYFSVLQEHGYFQSNSFHYCRVCEALNYNNRTPKVYENLDQFWTTKNCYASWDSKYE